MYTSLKGIYENGSLKLLEPAPDVERSDVVVTFLNESGHRDHIKKGIRLGSWEGKFSLPDDFNEPLDDLQEYM